MLSIGLIFIAFLTSAVATRLAILLPIKDIPNARSSHYAPVPRTGGIALGLTFLSLLALKYALPELPFPNWFETILFIALATSIWIVALIDDLRGLGAWPRLITQATAAILFVVFIGHADQLNLAPLISINLGIFGYVISVGWIIFFMNCFNFMDGINGIAAGTAIVVAICLAALSVGSFLQLAGLLMIGALAGFLIFNFPRGRVFLGDTGSSLLGFIFATIALTLPADMQDGLPFEVVPLLFFSFIFDVALTLLVRFRRGETLMVGHRDHLYQLLVRAGIDPVWVTLGHVMVTAITAIAVWLIHKSGGQYWLWLLIAALFAHLFYAAAVYRFASRRGVFNS